MSLDHNANDFLERLRTLDFEVTALLVPNDIQVLYMYEEEDYAVTSTPTLFMQRPVLVPASDLVALASRIYKGNAIALSTGSPLNTIITAVDNSPVETLVKSRLLAVGMVWNERTITISEVGAFLTLMCHYYGHIDYDDNVTPQAVPGVGTYDVRPGFVSFIVGVRVVHIDKNKVEREILNLLRLFRNYNFDSCFKFKM